MNRRELLRRAGIAAAGLGMQGCLDVYHKITKRKPNIVFIMSDDHAYQAISAYGSTINQTPNLDKMAAKGMLFENCFVTNSICAPCRAVILTGKHSHLNGVIDNGTLFDPGQQTVAKLLQRGGYETAVIGKWHVSALPDKIGFDYWRILPGQGEYYNPEFISPEGKSQITGYCTDIVTDLTIDWLENKRDRDKPFVLMCHHKAPHRTWEPGPHHLNMYDGVTIPEPDTLFDDLDGRTTAAKENKTNIDKMMSVSWDMKVRVSENDKVWKKWRDRLTDEQWRDWDAAFGQEDADFRKAKLKGKDLIRWKYQRYIKNYLRCIASVDDNVGQLMNYLDKESLADNTVVIYSSDQGFFLGEHGWFDKRWIYEESLRTPLIVRWPDAVKGGSRNDDFVSNLDFAQTFLDITGVEASADMQGQSLVPQLMGKKPKQQRDSFYYHYYGGLSHNVAAHYGVRTERYKLIYFYTHDEWELFDLKKDPKELKSVYDDPAYAKTVKRLKAELTRLRKQYGDSDELTVDYLRKRTHSKSCKLTQNYLRKWDEKESNKKN